ncbi:MAG: hypothetical protein ACRD1L_09750 [Terriglobales bacterium]
MGEWILPVVVAAVLVFIASSIVHMVLPWHKSDYPKLGNEDAVMDALRPLGLKPGDYMVPRPARHADMKAPDFVEKMKRGPVAIFTVLPSGEFGMGRGLALWFVYVLVVSALVALLAAGSGLGPGADYHPRFHIVALAAFLAYAAAVWPISIWFRRGWGLAVKATVDGFIYAVITGLVFAWLWPH